MTDKPADSAKPRDGMAAQSDGTLAPGNPDMGDLPLALQTVLRVAARVRSGAITITLPDGRVFRFTGDTAGAEGVINVKNVQFAAKLLNGATIGFAESYFSGQWDSPDIVALLQVVAQNSDQMEEYFKAHPVINLFQRLYHILNRNSRSGAKRNIMTHYDLGNEFFRQWLDRTMTYSSAKFERSDQPLNEAQRNKYRSLAERIDLRPEHSVLEIGSGWGGFAEYAAGEIGCRVTGITISPEQYDFARQRMKDKGLADKVEIRLQDYRDVSERYDRIASIEMFEAVGMQYWKTYFRKIYDCLAPGGLAGLQIITIDDRRFDYYRRGADFIQKYIFPGGMLPSPSALKKHIDTAGLALTGKINFGLDYAKTLSEWRDRFQASWPKIQSLGFDERFRLLWKYYLSYCEAGFRAGTIDVTQLTIEKPA